MFQNLKKLWYIIKRRMVSKNFSGASLEHWWGNFFSRVGANAPPVKQLKMPWTHIQCTIYNPLHNIIIINISILFVHTAHTYIHTDMYTEI